MIRAYNTYSVTYSLKDIARCQITSSKVTSSEEIEDEQDIKNFAETKKDRLYTHEEAWQEILGD